MAAGKLHYPEWVAAVRAIPRHELVPVFYEQDPVTGDWLTRDATDPAWHDRIYSNRALFTKIGEATGSWGRAVVGLSSTSTPGLMTRMLEALDVHDGHDVLEIGTGTGYNAALLAHRLGDTHVFSVDIDGDLVELARHRLGGIGYRPIVVAADGARGLPEHAPYHRVIATCSVSAIPRAWLEQTRIGGLILADVKLSVHAGNLVLLRRHADRVEGRFDRNWAGFMSLRREVARAASPVDAGEPVARDRHEAVLRTTDVDTLRPWDNLVAWFLAQLTVPTEIGYRHTLDEQTGRPADVLLTTADGSWCEISDRTDDGFREVREAGPTPLWRAVENAHQLWQQLGQPGWDRFGLTATTDRQWVWLDAPDSDHTWPLDPPPTL
ncbi:MAG: methyltransferase domain-containing protein [Pseudonocardiaceae bacterium]|nr:methyltransferase domain-containing protein [Pseudonocardiaceae bacterium]